MGVEERKQMLDLVRQVAERDRDISVRGVAQYIDTWLGGLPPRSGGLTPNKRMQLADASSFKERRVVRS
jgi:hypothetical protein